MVKFITALENHQKWRTSLKSFCFKKETKDRRNIYIINISEKTHFISPLLRNATRRLLSHFHYLLHVIRVPSTKQEQRIFKSLSERFWIFIPHIIFVAHACSGITLKPYFQMLTFCNSCCFVTTVISYSCYAFAT